jgi:hypothetical protein
MGSPPPSRTSSSFRSDPYDGIGTRFHSPKNLLRRWLLVLEKVPATFNRLPEQFAQIRLQLRTEHHHGAGCCKGLGRTPMVGVSAIGQCSRVAAMPSAIPASHTMSYEPVAS